MATNTFDHDSKVFGARSSETRPGRLCESPQGTDGSQNEHRLSALLRSSCTLNPLDFDCGYLSGSRTAMPSPIGLVTSASGRYDYDGNGEVITHYVFYEKSPLLTADFS